MRKTKQVQAVNLVRRIRDAHYERLNGTTPAERIAFYREKAQALHEKLGALPHESRGREASEVVRSSALVESRGFVESAAVS
jgi:hypothetical protein